MAATEPPTQNPSSAATSTSTGPFTALITGISPLSPISTEITTSLISHLTTRVATPRSSPHQPQAQAQALSIALLGPDRTYLESTIAQLRTTFPPASHPTLNLLAVSCTLTSAESLGLAAHQIRATPGAWDLFVHHASAHIVESEAASSESQYYVHEPATVRGSDADTWWGVFELNVHALHHVARHFFSKMKRGAKFVNILPVPASISSSHSSEEGRQQLFDRGSAEHAAALAAAKVVEYLATEHMSSSGLVCVNVGIEERSSRLLTLPSAEEIVQVALSEQSC